MIMYLGAKLWNKYDFFVFKGCTEVVIKISMGELSTQVGIEFI